MKRLAGALIGLALGLSPFAASAQELRSDSPLWTDEAEPNEALYPRPFLDDKTFGCVHIIRTGLYRWTAAEGAQVEFWRLDNYGVFHCALMFGSGAEEEAAEEAFTDHAWIVKLDTIPEAGGGETELLALQIGVRTGSQYILLRRRKGEMTRLEELAPGCPPSAERRTARVDIWGQDVCVVASQDQLRDIARAANQAPAAARLDLISNASDIVPGSEIEAPSDDTPEGR